MRAGPSVMSSRWIPWLTLTVVTLGVVAAALVGVEALLGKGTGTGLVGFGLLYSLLGVLLQQGQPRLPWAETGTRTDLGWFMVWVGAQMVAVGLVYRLTHHAILSAAAFALVVAIPLLAYNLMHRREFRAQKQEVQENARRRRTERAHARTEGKIRR